MYTDDLIKSLFTKTPQPIKTIDRSFVRYPESQTSTGEVWLQKSKNRNIKLSVIIPTSDGYRNGYFPRLLDQIELQTFREYELIVIKGDNRQGAERWPGCWICLDEAPGHFGSRS